MNRTYLSSTILNILLLSSTSIVFPSVSFADDTSSKRSSVTESQQISIPAGSLETALNQFGQQTGLLISFSADLVRDQSSPGAKQARSIYQALDQILAHSGLRYVQNGELSYTILPIQSADQSGVDLPQLNIEALPHNPEIKTLTSIEMRQSMRSDLAEALSIIPSVRVDNTASSSLQQGDIKPAELSIRGAAPYQNKLMLDGASIDSRLDPALEESASNYTRVAGHSQGLFVDPTFLDNLTVIDVNASASEGGFVGGVVKAETKAYSGRDEFQIKHRKTQDSWTEFHVDESQEGEFFEDGARQLPTGLPGDYHPKFRKSETALQGATRIGDIGVFAGYSEKESHISQKQLVQLDFDYFADTGRIFKPSDEKTLDKESRYGVVRFDLLERDYDLNASVAYSDYYEDSFLINYIGSDFEGQHQGLNASVNFGKQFADTRMDLNLNAGTNADQREFESNTIDQYKYTSIYEAGIFGGYGDLANRQYTIGSTLNFTTSLNESHVWRYGTELKWARYMQDRGNDFTFNEYTLDFTQPLPPQTSPGSWAPSDQFHSREVIYQAGKIAFDNMDISAFTELNGDYQHVFWRAGVRVEHDDWLDNVNLAPRIQAGVYLNNTQTARITVGANRYYGMSFLSYRLREEERSRMSIRERDSASDNWTTIDPTQEWEFRDLDTPYDDEYSVGLYAEVLSGQAGLQYVERQGRKQIRTHYDSTSEVSWFENSGSSNTQQVDLFWRSSPFRFAGMKWLVNSTVSWMDKDTDARYGDSGGYLSSVDANEQVIFEGNQVARRALPAGDFATPVTANLDIIMQAFDDRLLVKNSWAFTNGYKYLKSLGKDDDTGLDSYETENQGRTTRWDISVEYALLSRPSSPYIRADIINVSDKRNVVTTESGTQLFGLGRQFWFEIGYRY